MIPLTRDELIELTSTVSRWVSDHPFEIPSEDVPVDSVRWRAMDDLGVLSALTPIERSGMDLGLEAAAAVLEVLGGALEPGPLTWNLLAPRYLGATFDGMMVTGLDRELPGPPIVAHLDSASVLLDVSGEDVRASEMSSVSYTPLQSLDPSTPVGLVSGDRQGDVVGDAAAAAGLRTDGALLAAAQLVGIARRSVATAVVYAGDRVQFGRPVGSFQGLKHLLADVHTEVEVAAALVASAARDRDLGDELAARRAGSAKALAGRAGLAAARACIQVHGGIGYTWEAIPHMLYKRAVVVEQSFGSSDHHLMSIAAALGGDC